MPIYQYECTKCGREFERVKAIRHRDELELCACGGNAKRVPAQAVIGKPGSQMQAVLKNGAHLKGHFGKEAKRNGR